MNALHMLSEKLQSLVKKRFGELTEIQKLVIPLILKNKNLLVIAPTGLGKTESCMLPFFHKMLLTEHQPISLLYITPMRSLNRDLLDRLLWWCEKLDFNIMVRHGDTTQFERKIQREMPGEILITTPETLGAILPGKRMREHLSNVKYVVVDEVHEIVNSKRGVQLSLLLARLQQITAFQIVCLSATVGEPKKVAKFFGLEEIVTTKETKQYEISTVVPEIKKVDKEISKELFLDINITSKIRYMKELIEQHNASIVFTNTRETSEAITSRLRMLDKTFQVEAHHGSLSKDVRIRSEKSFKHGSLKALVATSSLELGIDIGRVDLVIQYLSPRQVVRLIQRIGRSGHRKKEVSRGVIITGGEDVFESYVIAKRALEQKLEKLEIHENALDVLAHEIIGFLLDRSISEIDKLYSTIKRIYMYRNLKKDEFIDLLHFLEVHRMIWINENILKLRKKAWKYYFENLSTIPDTKRVAVIDMLSNMHIAYLDDGFVAEFCEEGNSFICQGKIWRVIQQEKNKLYVEPSNEIESAIPCWEGELIPVSYEVAQEVGKLRKRLDAPDNLKKEMLNVLRQQEIIPDNETFLIEHERDIVVIHFCGGTKVNNTISHYLAGKLLQEQGTSINIKHDAYRIILQTLVKPEKIVEYLKNADNLTNVISSSIVNTSLYKYRFLHSARRFGVISKDADFDKTFISKIVSQYLATPLHKEVLREIFLEKFDIKKAEDVIKKLKNGKIKIVIKPKISYLGKLALVQQFPDIIKPEIPEKEIFNIFKNRIMNTSLKIFCIHCKDFLIQKRVKEFKEKERCMKCGSGLLAIVPQNFTKKDAINLTEKQIKKLYRSASLAITYGKKYFLVSAAHGVGIETAARILSQYFENEKELLKKLFEVEKQWRKTRIYWK